MENIDALFTENTEKYVEGLKNYNYSKNGYYFITICINNRLNLLGKIIVRDTPHRPLQI